MELSERRRFKTLCAGVIPLVFVVALMAYVFGPGSDLLNRGVTLPEITIERVDFVKSEIHAVVRNTGPVPVAITMADVNDRIQPAAVEPDGYLERYETALVRIPFEWNVAEPYRVGITIDDGTRFEKEINAAAPATQMTADTVGFFALVGSLVGVVPVAIGMLWIYFISQIRRNRYHFFLALTAGLLLFLGIDSVEEALEISAESLAPSFNGVMLISTIIVVSFLGLYYAGERLVSGNMSAKPLAVALMISVGIGVHNFGEGLAIGAALGMGSIAFGAFLIVGFALHNTTEGIAIAAAASRARTRIATMAALALVAGSPAIFGSWIGGFSYWPFWSVIFLSVGAGAIFQVMAVLLKWIRDESGSAALGMPVASGIATGMLIMYVTSIIV